MRLKKWLLGLVTFAAMAVICAVCAGAEMYEDFNYISYYDNTATITKYVGSAENVDIPASIDGNKVTSIDDDAFYKCTSIKSVTIPDSVTSIGYNAFEGCTSLKSVKIPEGVTSISTSAFFGCSSLTSVTIPDSVESMGGSVFSECVNLKSVTVGATEIKQAFYGCTSLTSVTITNSVTSISYETFNRCTSLTSITIPSSVTSIYSGAFEGCTSLTEIKVADDNPKYISVNGVLYNKEKTAIILYPEGKKDKNYKILDGVTVIGGGAFIGCANLRSITIPNSVTKISGYAFESCTGLTNITIPNGVTSIDYGTFLNCTSLKTVNIPNSVNEIDIYAFEDCTSLKNVIIPTGVTSIDDRVFNGCASLTTITIPDTVTSIGDSAFKDCTSLASITIPNSVTSIDNSALSGCKSLAEIKVADQNVNYISVNGVLYNKNKTSILCYPTGKKDANYKIIDGVTSIEYYAFQGRTNLKSITIPDSVTSIGENAFRDCTSLTSVTMPDSVTSIGENAFRDCTSLTSVTMPDSVISIGENVFRDCTSLTSVTISNSVSEIGEYAFEGCTSLKTVTIPNSVTEIGNYAFSDCSSLTSITIPDGVTSIGSSAFEGCTSLASITIPDGVTSIGSSAFEGCTSLASITIPDSVTSIDRYAFCGCTSLASVTILDSVTEIGDYAFSDCTSLTVINVATENQNYVSVNGVLHNKDKTAIICYPAGKKDKNYKILDGVTSIGYSAFSDCASLTSVTIPDSVTSIGYSAFSDCASLTNVAIPDSVSEIGSRTFWNCPSLKSITIPASVTSIGADAFGYNFDGYADNGAIISEKTHGFNINYVKNTWGHWYATKNGFSDETCLVVDERDDGTLEVEGYAGNDKTYVIPDEVNDKKITSIKSKTFENCIELKSVTIPASVKIIGNTAFRGCVNLTNIMISDGMMSIDAGAFLDCINLKNVTIPASVSNIRYYAFGYFSDNSGKGNKKIYKFKIYCYSGTAGEQYAIENGFDYVLLDKLPTLSKVTNAKLTGRAADDLRINWTKNANADGYIVEMYQNGKWERVAKITNSNTTTYRKVGLKAGTVYNFRVKAYKMYGSTAIYSEYSATVTARTNPSVTTGAKLGGRAADALRVNWSKNASADGYIVEMYQGNKWVRVAKITSNSTTTFKKSGLKASSVYKFRVRAYKMSGKTALYSNYSATVTAMTNPSVMAGAKLGGRAADALRINWTKNTTADGYIVEMYQGNKWVRVAKITNSNTTTFRKAGLKASSVYKFRVRAYKMSGKTALYGNYSATVTARTNPSIVKGVKIGGKAKDALRVNWTKNSSAQGYIVEMYKGGKWVRVAKITNGNTTTFRKAGLAKNTAYKFRVKAYYMSGKTALYGNYGSVSGKTAAK